MKKLIIALTAVALAVGAQAASFSWKTAATGKVYEAGTTTLLASGMAYLIDADVTSQATLLSAFADGSLNLDLVKISSATITAGAFTNTGFDYEKVGVGQTINAYVAILADDMLFISGSNTANGQEGKTSAIANFSLKTPSQAVAFTDASSYQGAGWYAAAVPEPTSGLLLLLGMAGLALKRKQA